MANPAAAAFWEIATPSYRKIAENWVASAKREETRESRLVQLIEDSAVGLLIKPQRYGDEPKWVARAAEAARQA
ncbi:YdeI/OmpD-associated family protein [Nocardioides sp. B-3]|uniref:YdeI/OmpD-associated family protein n=1 Tax=Nocardioides sp. B-3 TaxID=2895565 RepID=UPI0021536F9D|nr:YdeI/OmpD-associated family protein [Nocardioides sp. B-3]UUZ60831.1 YdeI/OmpD-associated family protein [Nocardioides sp. B-3]